MYAVLVEATAVIVRAAAVEQPIQGGWEALGASLPEQGICSDDELVGISLIDPAEVRQLVDRLVALGLTSIGKAISKTSPLPTRSAG